MVTVPCVVTVAAGVFAPGHLGELTRYLPFELVDDVLEMTGAVQKRMRALPSRVGMYFVLAMTLFPGIGSLNAGDRMTGALAEAGLRGVALGEAGARGLRGAVSGGQGERAEVPLARKLVCLLGEGMLLLADRAYDAADLLTAIAATGAQFLVRGSASRKPGVGEI